MECKLQTMKKQNKVLQVKLNEALHRNAEMFHDESLINQQDEENKNTQNLPGVDIVNKGWEIIFIEDPQHIASLMTTNKQNCD